MASAEQSVSVPPENSTARGTEVPELLDHLFRQEAGKMVATLARIFGVEHLSLAEDVMQEALGRALQTWPFFGVPENPTAWLMRTARNLALDVLRRNTVFREKEPDIVAAITPVLSQPEELVFREEEIADDRLRLMFVCCHPSIPAEARSALALKTLCGFGITEISHAFLTSEAAIAKRLTRAKQKIRESKIRFEIPSGPELTDRLDGVLHCLYLLFNEGYKASTGKSLVRKDICAEAIRLGELLAQHRAGDTPRTHALLALMLLNAARLPARVDQEGRLVRLEQQDRRLWNQALIARGMYHLAQSADGASLSRYHVEAGIAACHISAPDYASIDWPQILALYDRLLEFDNSPVVQLNRAVAVANVHGAEAGLETLEKMSSRNHIESYYLLHSIQGDFEMRRGKFNAAATHFERALQLAELESEREFLAGRIRQCTDTSLPQQPACGSTT